MGEAMANLPKGFDLYITETENNENYSYDLTSELENLFHSINDFKQSLFPQPEQELPKLYSSEVYNIDVIKICAFRRAPVVDCRKFR